MMVSWPIVKAEMHRNPPPPKVKTVRWQFWFGFKLGFLVGGFSVAAMILAWRLYLPLWMLGV
jgi:hypothetical protein